MYASGNGVDQDTQLALQWYRNAAKQGYADAQYNMGLVYTQGIGVAIDSQQALQWYRKAANHGHAKALACPWFAALRYH